MQPTLTEGELEPSVAAKDSAFFCPKPTSFIFFYILAVCETKHMSITIHHNGSSLSEQIAGYVKAVEIHTISYCLTQHFILQNF